MLSCSEFKSKLKSKNERYYEYNIKKIEPWIYKCMYNISELPRNEDFYLYTGVCRLDDKAILAKILFYYNEDVDSLEIHISSSISWASEYLTEVMFPKFMENGYDIKLIDGTVLVIKL